MPLNNPVLGRLNSLTYCLKRAFGPCYESRLFMALVRFYYRYVVRLARLFSPLFGAAVVLAVTYRCQCSCAHCGVSQYDKDGENELTGEEMEKLLSELGKLGAGEIHFFGGEPLVSPRIVDYVRLAKAAGMSATLDTNGLLLDEAFVLRLKSAGLDNVGVSIDSADAAEHDALRRCPGAWLKAVEAVRLCVKHGLPCCISAVAEKYRLLNGGMAALLKLGAELGVKIRFLSPIRSGQWAAREDVPLSPDEIKTLRGLLSRGRAYWGADYLNSPEIPYLCGVKMRNQVAISAYGDVMPCSYLPASFGNVRKEPLRRIIRRLWAADIFGGAGKLEDCPLNHNVFRKEAGELISRLGSAGGKN